jgi:hypothetical protein
MIHDFDSKLAYSQGERQQNDIDTLMELILGCVSVEKTDTETDKTGIDYIATLRSGATIRIDAKTRERGCSRFWHNGPELAPEKWSVRPGGKYAISRSQAKAGWTLSEANDVDYIYCTFHDDDCRTCWLLPFQLYRMAFSKNLLMWACTYKSAIQDSGTWESECIFIPASVVTEAINDEMRIDMALSAEVPEAKQAVLF